MSATSVVPGVVVAGGRDTPLSILTECLRFGEGLAGIHKLYATAVGCKSERAQKCRADTREVDTQREDGG